MGGQEERREKVETVPKGRQDQAVNGCTCQEL